MATRRLWRRGGNWMRQANRLNRWLITATLATMALDGCVVLAVGAGAGAVGGAVVVAKDRRSTGIQLEDQQLESRVMDALIGHIPKTAMNITVTSYNRRVLLAGEVRTAEMRVTAE